MEKRTVVILLQEFEIQEKFKLDAWLQSQIQSCTLEGRASDFLYCLFHGRSFFTQLFAIEHVAFWGAWPFRPHPLDPLLLGFEALLASYFQKRKEERRRKYLSD